MNEHMTELLTRAQTVALKITALAEQMELYTQEARELGKEIQRAIDATAKWAKEKGQEAKE